MVCAVEMGEVCLQETDILPSFINNIVSRLLGFGACLIGAAICFFVSFITLPFLALRFVHNSQNIMTFLTINHQAVQICSLI